MKKIFCVTSLYSVGCTFLDWSIHWLSGQDKFFSIDQNKYIDLTSDPLNFDQVSNAHNHRKNHPSGFKRTVNDIKKIQSLQTEGLFSIYPCPLTLDLCCKELAFSREELHKKYIHDQVLDFQKKDYVEMLQWLVEQQKIPVIFVDFDLSVVGYKWSCRSLCSVFDHETKVSVDEKQREIDNLFFPDSRRIWQDLGLDNIWDQRERLALDSRPFEVDHQDLTLPFPHLWINCQDLWFDGQRTVPETMEFLELELDRNRLEHWEDILYKWQYIQNDNLKFYRLLPQIIKATINGHYQPIPELTVEQESIIQHCLIYDHGLNLKTWNIEKFPDNTKELHKLLEPNTHLLSPREITSKKHGA